MRILLTANAAWNILNFRRALIDSMLGDGHSLTVLAPADETIADLKHLGCNVLPLEMSVKGLNPYEDLQLQRTFYRAFLDIGPDAVLSYTIKNNIFGARAAKSLGIPFLPNVTGLGTAFLSGRIIQTVTEHLYRGAFASLPVVFFQNEDDLGLFLHRRLVRPDQARILPGSGIDLQRFFVVPLPAPEKAPVFLMIARLLRDKGVIEYVEAARKVKVNFPQARFQLLGAAGTANRSAIDRPMVEAWIAEGVIEYLETLSDVRPAIASANCVVLPSYREGAPRTLIEAAAMARPLIATDVPGCRAVVDHEVSGFLCKARSAESLAAAMERFLGLTAEAQGAMGAAGRKKMEREYDQAFVVGAYREALRVIASR